MDNEYEYYGKKKDGVKDGFGIIVWNNNFDYETELTDNNSCYNDAQSLNNFRVEKQHTFHQRSERISIPKSTVNKGFTKSKSPGIHKVAVQNDRSKGVGIQKYNHKETKLIGLFSEDKITGIAKYLKTDGCEYKGELIQNIANGYGVFRSKSAVTYEGDWVNDQQHGYGIEIGVDSTYVGQFSEGLKSGLGIYNWKDGSNYEGEWSGNSMHGNGSYMSADGKMYRGEFFNSSMHGFGELIICKNEKYYYGYFNQDKKDGFGVFIYLKPHFKAYLGFWKNSKQNGLGKLITERALENIQTLGDNFKKQPINLAACQSKYGFWENGERVKWIRPTEDLQSYLHVDEKRFLQHLLTNWNNLSFFLNKSD